MGSPGSPGKPSPAPDQPCPSPAGLQACSISLLVPGSPAELQQLQLVQGCLAGGGLAE